MTPTQQRLFDQVEACDDGTGRDLRDILRELPGTLPDKRAVADALGGPGAGARDFPDPS
jgi:hypothetical protein